jgi:S1-C subfamily serine protease
VIDGGAAAKAGLGKGDVILAFGPETVFTVDDLHRLLTAEIAGIGIELTVMRRGRIETLQVTPDLDD